MQNDELFNDIHPNNRILLSVNTAYFIPFINLFSSLWVLVSIQILVLTVHMLW